MDADLNVEVSRKDTRDVTTYTFSLYADSAYAGTLTARVEHGTDVAFLFNFRIFDAFRGKGLAKIFMKLALQTLEDYKPELIAQPSEDGIPSDSLIALYMSCGFEVVSHMRLYGKYAAYMVHCKE